MLHVENLASRYGRIEALHDMSFRVERGEIVALVGSNGAGKTTLLKALAGVQPTSGGVVRLNGTAIDAVPSYKRVELGMALVPEGRQIFAPLSVEDNLLLGAWTRRGRQPTSLDRVFAYFPILKEFRARSAGSLSGGQQQMLAVGRALMSEPRLLLLDEPSMGLAPQLVEQIFAVLKDIRNEGVTVLVVEQNVHAVLQVADRGYVIEMGRVTLEGEGRALLVDPRVQAAYLGAP